MNDNIEYKAIIEGLLFLSGEDGITTEEISKIVEIDINEVESILKELYNEYENPNRGIRLEFLGNHFKLTTKNEHKNYYKKLVLEEEDSPLSNSCIQRSNNKDRY